MGAMDRVIRFFIVLIIGALYAVDMISGMVATVFGGIAGMLILTSFFSIDLVYMAFGWSTVEKAFSGRKKRRR